MNEWMKNLKEHWKKITAMILVLALVFSGFRMLNQYHVAAGDMNETEESGTVSDENTGTEQGLENAEIGENTENVENGDNGNTNNMENTAKPEETAAADDNKEGEKSASKTENKNTTGNHTNGKNQTETTKTPDIVAKTKAPEAKETETPETIKSEVTTKPRRVVRSMAVDTSKSEIPTTVEKLNNCKNDKDELQTTFNVTTYEDLWALQELSKVSSLDGYTFIFSTNNTTGQDWELKNNSNFSGQAFKGLGSEQYPFRGTIKEKITGVGFYLGSNPFFQCLGSGAFISNINIIAENSKAGMAETVLITDQNSITYENVSIRGTVSNENGAAGALYGTVKNTHAEEYTLSLNKDGINIGEITDGEGKNISGIISVTGKIAGGYIGKISGNIKLVVSNGENMATTVLCNGNGGAVGGIVGLVSGGSFQVESEIILTNKIQNNGTGSCAGGLIGRCVNATVRSVDGKVTTIAKTEVVNGVTTVPEFYATQIAGGYIGEAINSNIEISNFVLDRNVYAKNTSGSYAGGVIGRYQVEEGEEGSLQISDIGVTKDSKIAAGSWNDYDLGTGGIAGYIQGDNVTVSAIKATGDGNTFLPNLAYRSDNKGDLSNISEVGKKGGIVGILEGKNITISNVEVAFSSNNAIGGKYTGYVAGYVNPASKVKLDNITVSSTYSINQKNPADYIGGLMGCVKEGCIVALSGTIDLSKISYENNKIGGLSGKNKGYVAGYQTESLIYLEEGGTLKRNEAVENHTIGTEDSYNNDLEYLLDDLGNYGSVFHNVRDKNNQLVIQYDKEYGEEVTGTVSFEDSKYQLTEDADALRLAIALNTFDSSKEWSLRFAKKCFQTDATPKTLLAASYQVTGDLDFQKTGIYSLCRNDDRKYAFTGNMEGNKNDGTYPTISFYMISKQKYGGLFTQVGSRTGTSSFKNLHLTGILYYAGSMGGIAPFAEGNITLDGITTDVEMRANSNNGGNDSVIASNKVTCEELQYYSGIFGYYDLQGNIFSCKNCIIAPTIKNIRVQQVAGGLVGWLKTPQRDTISNIQIFNITIQSKIKASELFNKASAGWTQARLSGMIAQISYDMNYNLYSEGTLGGSHEDYTDANMELDGVIVSGASIDMSPVQDNPNNIRVTGGFLGYEWENVEVSGGAIKVQDNSVIKSLGRVGGLVTTFAGKLDFNGEVSLDSMEMADCVSGQKYNFSSLLVADGRNAIITIIDENYNINQNNVKVDGYLNFDELVGVNLALMFNNINNSGWVALEGDYKSGGIVNIIKPEFFDITNGHYKGYENHVISQGNTNQYTRYYYNLFGEDYEEISVRDEKAVIDSSEKLMLWHLYKYSNLSIRRFIKSYFVDEKRNKPSDDLNSCILTGTLDMQGYSFYPSPADGETYKTDGATLILHGEELEQLVNRKPNDSKQQHYLMHAGLFSYVNGVEITGTGLTLKGTITNLGESSGALVAGNVAGGTMTVTNVTCAGIRIANYISTNRIAVALLISKVSDNATLNMKGITTTSYDSLGENSYAAAALIGKVGSENATSVRVTFEDMKVEDRKEKVFKYASFIYSYNYSNDSNANQSIGIYTFTKEEFGDEKVTFGSELSYGMEYSDEKADAALMEIISKAAITYNPYVYIVKNIWINPKMGDLTEGCGTYEDPYVISNTRQFLSLYCYLTSTNSGNNYEGAYKNIFQVTDWKVNPIKGSTTNDRCDKESGNHKSVSYKDKTNFPRVDQMRKAYYVITTDLDMTKYSDLCEYIMEKDFAGLGTMQNPFSGVLIGQKTVTNGAITTVTNAAITLPKQESTSGWNTYGLIQYMKGAVVKDLDIKTPEIDGTYKDNKIKIQENGNGGGVAAVVLGGDNIIDNVSVDMQFELPTSNTETIRTGGYVGTIKKGSVIIRGMEKNDVEKYGAYHKITHSDYTTTFESINYDTYPKNCRVIGMVEDGCVIYEGTLARTNHEKKVLEQADLGFDVDKDANIPLSYSFPLINGAYLEDNCQGGIEVKRSSEGYTITLKNEAQLEIAALALNSDAFAIYNSGTADTEHINGYDYTAICRKAEYNDVGKAENSTDYQNAIKQDDNIGYYPYLCWKYMNFAEFTNYMSDGIQKVYEETIENVTYNRRLSKLNWANGITEVTTYQLVSNQTYDMTDYGRSFRGFGGLYQPEYSQFGANFDGKGATVIINMVRDWDSDIQTTGMFNDLTTYRKDGFTIQNIHFLNSCFDSSKTKASSTGALAGNVKGVWNFKDISFAIDETAVTATQGAITSSQYLGGMVGCIRYYSKDDKEADKQKISFNECKVMGTAEKKCKFSVVFNSEDSDSLEGNSGGLVGYVEGFESEEDKDFSVYTFFGNILFTDCAVQHCDIEIQSDKRGSLGGFVGRVGNCFKDDKNGSGGRTKGSVNIEQTDSTISTVEDTAILSAASDKSSVGGLIGEYCGVGGEKLDISGVKLKGLRLENKTPVWSDKYGVGGLVGGLRESYVFISDVEVMNSIIGTMVNDNQHTSGENILSTGGLLGIANTFSVNIKNAKVLGCQIKTGRRSDGNEYAYAGGFIGNGGISNGGSLTIGSDNREKGNIIKNTTIHSEYGAAGGLVGSNKRTTGQAASSWNLSNITVDNSKIYSGVKEQEGDITINQNDEHAAGGILGKTIFGIAPLNISNICIENGTEIAATDAGGLIGKLPSNAGFIINIKLSGDIFVGCSSESAISGHQKLENSSGAAISDKQVSCTSGVAIYGYKNAGGLYGYEQITGTEDSNADIRIYHTKIGAYATDNNSDVTVGGIAGWKVFNGKCRYDGMDIKECVIVANKSKETNLKLGIGGIIGWSENGWNTECDYYIYNPKLTDNSIGYMEDLETLQDLKDIDFTSDKVKLLENNSSTNAKHWTKVTGGITEENVGTYSGRIGNYLGGRTSIGKGNLYILRPELKYSSGFTGSRPAIDVGNASTGNQGDSNDNTENKYGYGYPYEWRQWCHIINFEPEENTQNPIDDTLISSIDTENKEQEYLYSSIDNIMTNYQSAVSGSAFLDAYRLNVNMNDPIEGDKYKILDYYNKFVKEKEVNGVKVVYAEGGTAQSTMDSVIGILTNAGGIRGTDTNSTKYMSISVTPAVVTNGEIKASSKEDASLKVDKSNNTFEYSYHDEELADGSCTISLVTIQYGWQGADTKGKYETIYIPVFVVQRIDFYNNIHIMEGEQYSLEYAHSDKSYSDYVTVAHDSTYTLFVEMAYGNGRTKPSYKNYALNKTLKFEWNSLGKVLQKGVKLTLVDVLTQKPYYYEVTEPTSSIDFSDFKDADGNSYEEHTVGTIDDIAKVAGFEYDGQKFNEEADFKIEQYYIHVDCSDVEEKINNVFQVTVNTDNTNPTQLSFFNRTETQKVEILSIPGLEIQFLDKGNEKTKVSGEISKDGRIQIDTGIEIKAGFGDLYWTHKSQSGSVFIDSQNNGKYLDIAISLIDNETKKPVTLPANTNFIVSGGAVASVGQSVVYTYKDWGNKFSLGSITKDITTGPSLIEQEDGTKVSNECHIELDFSVADIDQYVSSKGKSYTIQLELRRTSNPDYPLGGDMLDSLTTIVFGNGSKEMAVALDVKDTMNLGINTYQQTNTTYTIPFKSKLDFSGMISKPEDASDSDTDVIACADKKYLITYRIKKKVKNSDNTYKYVPIETNGTQGGMTTGDKLKLRFDKDANGNMVEATPVTYQNETVYQTVKEFTAEQIANGTVIDDKTIKCMLAWDCELEVDTEGISTTDYSNYKVEMTVLPYDKTDSEGKDVTSIPTTDKDSKLVDYFIFTLGRLKTDR